MTRSLLGAAALAALMLAACGGGRAAPAGDNAALVAAVASARPVPRDAGAPGTPYAAEDVAPDAASADAGSTGIPECDRYLAAIERLVACEALPEEQRASLRELGREQRELLEVLGDPKIREERRRSAADACRRGAASLDQAFAKGACGGGAAPPPAAP